MPKRALFVSTLAAVLAVQLTLVGYQWPSLWLVYVCKPLATLLIISIALQNWARPKSPYSRWIVSGLCLSLVGDVLLIWPNQYFLPGLAAFLITHATYLVAFTRDAKFPAQLPVLIGYLAVAALFYTILFPTLPSGLQIPVALYAILLSTMAGQAMGRLLVLKTSSAQRAAVGALFFMLSDLLLAFHRFRTPLLYANVLILVPYYFGQLLISWSTKKPPETRPARYAL